MHLFRKSAFWFAIALAFQLLAPRTAAAWEVDLVAEAICESGVPRITFTASEPFGVSHNNIEISFNGVLVATGVFSDGNGHSFSGNLEAPASSPVTVTALAAGQWEPHPVYGVDPNGGGQSASVLVTIPTDCAVTLASGRFTGGGKSIDVGTGLKVTKGFTIHCDLKLSNNLEINWPSATKGKTNQFHMLQHTSAVCSDDAAILQPPPAAPVDRIDGVGIGRYNGEEGFTVEFTLIDAGEPGTNDQIGFKVYRTSNPAEVVLLLPTQVIVGGNVQAHFDQPHKAKKK